MKPQEALEQMKQLHQYCFCSQPQFKAMGFNFTQSLFEAAEKALKKQVAAKHHHTRIDEVKDKARISVCPSCLGCIITKENEFPKHCVWCGQKIDWSEEE